MIQRSPKIVETPGDLPQDRLQTERDPRRSDGQVHQGTGTRTGDGQVQAVFMGGFQQFNPCGDVEHRENHRF